MKTLCEFISRLLQNFNFYASHDEHYYIIIQYNTIISCIQIEISQQCTNTANISIFKFDKKFNQPNIKNYSAKQKLAMLGVSQREKTINSADII